MEYGIDCYLEDSVNRL